MSIFIIGGRMLTQPSRLRFSNMDSEIATYVKGLIWKEILGEPSEKVPHLEELIRT
jgi:hypothetical protein